MAGGTDPTLSDFMAKLVVWYATNYGGTSDHDRQTTRIAPASAPTTLLSMQAKYQEVAGIKEDTGFTSIMMQQWIIMLSCTAYNSADISWTYKCYDNVFADTILENGAVGGIYSYFDLFTWRGLISFTGVYVIEQFLAELFDNMFWTEVLILEYFMNEGNTIKYCDTGDLTISDPWGFGWFEFDICDALPSL